MGSHTCAVAISLIVGLLGCAPVLPEAPIERALVRDMSRIVDARDQLGWTIDDIDVLAALPDALASVCRVGEPHREAARLWLDERIHQLGGDVAQAYLSRGKDLEAVRDLLLLTRTRLVLTRASAWANEGKCPFWLEVDEAFSGVQGFNKKLVLSLETGARFYVQLEGNKPGFGGGGGGRALLGYGFTDRFTLLSGLELGGAGRFTDISLGERVQVPAVLVFMAAPLIARFHYLSDYIETELGPVGYLNQLRGELQLGGRVGLGLGFSRLVLLGFIPGLTFSVNYDYIPRAGSTPTVHQLGAGLRGSFSRSF